MNRRSGLGRGLAALIPQSPSAEEADTPDPAGDEPGDEAVASGAADEGDEETSSSDPGEDTSLGGDASASDTPDGHDPADDPAVRADRAPELTPDASHGPDASAHPGADAAHDQEPPPDVPATTTPDMRTDPSTTPLVSSSAATLAELDPSSIVPNPRQPREVFDPEELEGLAMSLADLGVLQPLVVRPLHDGRYELIAGERRLRAAKIAGLARIPAVVRHTDDANLLKEALVENIHRVQLNPLEEAAAYQQLLEEFGVTQEELATSLGRSRPAISNAIRLLQLPTAVQRRVAAGVLSAGHAKALVAIGDPAAQTKLADKIVAEGLSVRATEELIRLRYLEEPPPQRSTRRRTVSAPGLIDLQEDLSDALMARVRIAMGVRKGKLTIEFTSVDDLERIVSVIADGLDEGARPSEGVLRGIASGGDDTPGTDSSD